MNGSSESMMERVDLILYSLTIILSVFQLFVSLYIFIMMIQHRGSLREYRIDYLLFGTTYLTLIFVAIFFIDMCAYSIVGHLNPSVTFDGFWCRMKAYLMYGAGCTFFHSFLLQAFYRLNRILYQNKHKSQSFRFYVILSISIWIIVYIELIPSFVIGDIEYIVSEHHCQFAFTNVRGSIVVCTVGFFVPFSLTMFCYLWTMLKIHQQSAALMMINRSHMMRRDILILKRLVILLTFVTFVAAPHVIFPVVVAFDGFLPGWLFSLEWLLTALALVSVSIVLIFVSTHLKKICVEV